MLPEFGLHSIRGSKRDTMRKYGRKLNAKEYGTTSRTINQVQRKKKDLLKVDKMKNCEAQLKTQESIQPSDIKYIVPQSAEMKALVIAINTNL